MRITTRGRLAVAAMTDLALHQQLRPVALSAISARQRISLSYLEQLFSALRKAGIIESTRGPGGGYTLARPQAQITAADIVLAVESLDGDELGEERAAAREATGELWTAFHARAIEYLQSVTLHDLVTQHRERAAGPATPAAAPAPAAARPTRLRPGVPNSVFALGALALARK